MICMPLFSFTRRGNHPSYLLYSGVTGNHRYSGSIMVGGMQIHADGTRTERSFVIKILLKSGMKRTLRIVQKFRTVKKSV